jgi:hypothetical protein
MTWNPWKLRQRVQCLTEESNQLFAENTRLREKQLVLRPLPPMPVLHDVVRFIGTARIRGLDQEVHYSEGGPSRYGMDEYFIKRFRLVSWHGEHRVYGDDGPTGCTLYCGKDAFALDSLRRDLDRWIEPVSSTFAANDPPAFKLTHSEIEVVLDVHMNIKRSLR